MAQCPNSVSLPPGRRTPRWMGINSKDPRPSFDIPYIVLFDPSNPSIRHHPSNTPSSLLRNTKTNDIFVSFDYYYYCLLVVAVFAVDCWEPPIHIERIFCDSSLHLVVLYSCCVDRKVAGSYPWRKKIAYYGDTQLLLREEAANQRILLFLCSLLLAFLIGEPLVVVH